MRIATINCGSSSLKADVLDSTTGARALRLRVQRVGTDEASLRWNDDEPQRLRNAPLAEVL